MGRNRIEEGSRDALFYEAYDQAATAVAAYYYGQPVADLSLVAPQADDWRYRDDIFAKMDFDSLPKDDFKMVMTIHSVGSAAQFMAINQEHPIVDGMIGAGGESPAHEFARDHWIQIQAVAQRLQDAGELSLHELRKLLSQ